MHALDRVDDEVGNAEASRASEQLLVRTVAHPARNRCMRLQNPRLDSMFTCENGCNSARPGTGSRDRADLSHDLMFTNCVNWETWGACRLCGFQTRL